MPSTIDRLHSAAAADDVDTITSLIESRKVAVDARRQGITALHVAAHSGSAKAVGVLVQQGALVACTDRDGLTATAVRPALPSATEMRGPLMHP